jgi:hypothetical protein
VSGYTPVFDTVFQGTLCGKWPTLPVWLTILPMADKNGQIDMTYQHISAVSGWPVDLLKQAIAELTAPDPESRSSEKEGRRLELIDPLNRQWGWRVINHAAYREKARLSAKAAREVAEGVNKARMADRRSPPLTPSPNSYSNSKLKHKTSEDRLETVSEKRESQEALKNIREKCNALKNQAT